MAPVFPDVAVSRLEMYPRAPFGTASCVLGEREKLAIPQDGSVHGASREMGATLALVFRFE